MSIIINGLISDHEWHPMVVKHKQTHEVLTIKSTRFNPQIHELLKEYAEPALRTEIPFVGTAIHYDLLTKQSGPVEPVEVPVEVQEVEEAQEVAKEILAETTAEDSAEFIAGLPEDLEERFVLLKEKTKSYNKYFDTPIDIRKEYERVKKILNK